MFEGIGVTCSEEEFPAHQMPDKRLVWVKNSIVVWFVMAILQLLEAKVYIIVDSNYISTLMVWI